MAMDRSNIVVAAGRQGMSAPAIHWRVGSSAAPDDLWWDELTTHGYFENARTRPIVLYVARGGSEPRVVATARGFLAFLRRRLPHTAVEVLDLRRAASDWPDVPRVDLDAHPRRRLAAPRLPMGVDVPGRWLEPFFLVTIAGAAPDPHYVVSSVLAAQAELLRPQPGWDLDLVFEAHRLFAADLNVACGSRIYGDDTSDSWWAASTHDVSLEAAIAAAAGAGPLDVPQLAHLARHETTSMVRAAKVFGDVPRLERYLAPRSTVWRARARERLRHSSWMIGTDVRLAAANLSRIPQFVRRRWPRATEGAS